MKKNFLKIIIIVLTFLWMVFIFYMSNQNGRESSKLSGRYTDWMIRIFVKNYANLTQKRQIEIYKSMSYLIRKLAHFTEYAVLGLFSFLLAKAFLRKDKYIYPAAILCSILYAITDEFHQFFVRGRTPMIKDVIIDSAGAIIMILFVGILINLYRILKKGKKYD